MSKRRDFRTTVSLAHFVWKTAQEMMKAKGFNDNFSSYVADLIRRDKEREETKKVSSEISIATTQAEEPRKKAI